MRTTISTENTTFILISFEGPDLYSQAGGLGVRITHLAQTLGTSGFPTHLFFIGDPHLAGEEINEEQNLTLHRWCQWISEYYPQGCYQGENEKLTDFNKSLPGFIIENVIAPAIDEGRKVVVLGEEWHTAEVMCRINDGLVARRLRDRVILFWNANNTFSFDRINWARLNATTTITTVSRYMKHIMCGMGLNPLVIPNGIPRRLLNRINPDVAERVKRSVNAPIILSKVGRWDPAKRWMESVEAAARLKSRGLHTVLIARGGIEPHGAEVLAHARSLGLNVRDVECSGTAMTDYYRSLEDDGSSDILNLKFHCPQEFLRVIYNACTAVLANSGHEPFGLVGLETMAAGGIAFTGGTGEDYAIPFHNAIVLETPAPQEIETYIMYLTEHREEEERIRRQARQTAGLFTWEEVIRNLIQRLEYQANVQSQLKHPRRVPVLKYLEPITAPEPSLIGVV